MLDEELLDEAVRLSGAKTYSEAVRRALEELVHSIRSRGILELRGSGLWKGDLAKMRDDRRSKRKRKKR